jgi:hypothetical protein
VNRSEIEIPFASGIETKGRLGIELIPVDSEGWKGCINTRLALAEKEWIRSNQARLVVEMSGSKLPGYTEKDYKAGGKTVWDFLYPTFNCPYLLTRVGKVGDGGKWVCGMRELILQPNCVIYSFGVADEYSFEEELLRTAPNCRVRMYDPTSVPPASLLTIYGDRVSFTKLGMLGSGTSMIPELRTVKNLMEENGDEFIDILKVDVEGDEMVGLATAVADFPEALPFGQLQVEVHAFVFHDLRFTNLTFSSWRNMLEKNGLRTFSTELNLLIDSKLYMEVSFLNVMADIFRLPN